MTNSVTYHSASLGMADYAGGYRDAAKFIEFCMECRNYGRCWACPPFDCDAQEIFDCYKWATLFAVKIVPEDKTLPLDQSSAVIRPERVRIEKVLLAMEQQFDGKSFAYAGTCLYCPEGTCSRIDNKPCRHPELVRPSLEAVGFDIGRTSSELLGIDLKWSDNGLIPEYITLVSGFVHNSNPHEVEQSFLTQMINSL